MCAYIIILYGTKKMHKKTSFTLILFQNQKTNPKKELGLRFTLILSKKNKHEFAVYTKNTDCGLADQDKWSVNAGLQTVRKWSVNAGLWTVRKWSARTVHAI